MKKFLLNLFTCAALSLFIFTGCDVQVEYSKARTAPTVEVCDNSGVSVGFPRINNETKSISIYRYTVSGSNLPKDPTKDTVTGDKGQIIGILYPSEYPDESVHIFQDMYSKRGEKYCYRVLYKNSDTDITYSKWSAPIEFTGTMGLAKDLTLEANSLTFHKDSETITLSQAIAWPGDVASSITSEFSTSFYLALDCNNNGTEESILAKLTAEQAANTVPVRLNTLIPLSWFDQKITVRGLVAVKAKVNEEDSTKIKQYIFSIPTDSGISSEITCSTNASAGNIDYL